MSGPAAKLFQGLFDQVRDRGSSPRWLQDLRAHGLASAVRLGLPDRSHEEWRYTNVRSMINRHLTLPYANGRQHAPVSNLLPPSSQGEIRVVLLNGRYVPELSDLRFADSSVYVRPISDAIDTAAVDTRDFEAFDRFPDDGFTALNRALISAGIVVRISSRHDENVPIHIVSCAVAEPPEMMIAPRTMLIVDRAARATVQESFLATGPGYYLTNSVTDVLLAADARLQLVRLQRESKTAEHIAATRVVQQDGSDLASFSVETGARLSRHSLRTVLDGPGCRARLDGAFAATGEQLIDNLTHVEHAHPDCSSTQLYKGVLRGASTSVFYGKITVRPVAQRTDAFQLNKCLLLSPQAKMDTRPQLEISADDVRCTHGATVGPINPEELIYLQTRGIPQTLGEKMLCLAFLQEIFDQIRLQEVRNGLAHAINAKVDAISQEYSP